MLTEITRTTSPGYLLVAYAIFGLGSGLVNPPITNTAVSGMPPAQAGVAAAVASTSRQVGMTLGVAVLGAVAGEQRHARDFAAATHPGWWIVAALGVAVAILGSAHDDALGGRHRAAHRVAVRRRRPGRCAVTRAGGEPVSDERVRRANRRRTAVRARDAPRARGLRPVRADPARRPRPLAPGRRVRRR